MPTYINDTVFDISSSVSTFVCGDLAYCIWLTHISTSRGNSTEAKWKLLVSPYYVHF